MGGYRGTAARAARGREDQGVSMVESTQRSALVSHSILVAAALGVAQVSAYLVSVIAARALGPDLFGIVAALLGILLIGSVLAMGLQAVTARRIVAVGPSTAPRAAAGFLRVGLAGGLAVAVATVVLSPLLLLLLDLAGWLPLLMVAASFVPLTWLGAVYGVAQGRESFARLALAYAVVGALRGLGGVVGALLSGTVVGTLGGLLAGTVVGAVAARFVVAPLVQRPAATLPRVTAETLHATHALLALFVLTNIDVLIARALLSADDAGIYGVGAIIAKVAFWLPQFVGVVAFPRFADGRRSTALLVALCAVGGIGAVVVAATAALPGVVVAFVGGAQYTALIPSAWLFALAGSVFALGQALLLTRLAVEDRRAVFVVWAAAVLLLVLAVAVMPRTITGLIGSAVISGVMLAVVGLVVALGEGRSRANDR